MEPWFRWSWLLGIKPVHPKGWTTLGVWFVVAIPLMLASLGLLGEQPVLRAIASAAFVGSAIGFFWLVFWRLEGPSD
jgi:hypothetical protein